MGTKVILSVTVATEALSPLIGLVVGGDVQTLTFFAGGGKRSSHIDLDTESISMLARPSLSMGGV